MPCVLVRSFFTCQCYVKNTNHATSFFWASVSDGYVIE